MQLVTAAADPISAGWIRVAALLSPDHWMQVTTEFGSGCWIHVTADSILRLTRVLAAGNELQRASVEFHQNKRKWLSLCVYKPLNQNDSLFVEAICPTTNEYSAQYEHIVIFGDFNMSVENSHFQNLMQIYDLSPLIKEPTCFQSHNPTCIHNFLTNQKAMFKLSRLFETGLSDHHKLISVVMKSGVFRGPPRKKVYRSYKKFDLEHFNIALKSELEKLSDSAYNEFETVFLGL